MDKIVVAASTHWDREWYRTFQEFQIRLCDLMDRLLDLLETDEDFHCYTFDGQSVVLDDYLEIHPDNKERIKKLVKQGKLFFGPLYNLPDEFLSGGEGLIRNFLIGDEVCKEIGGKLKVGYVPDNFGHISQLPQILKGVGLNHAFFFRGTNIETVGAKEFYWEGADKTTVLAEYMILGYWSLKSWGRLGMSPSEQFEKAYKVLKSHAKLPVFLLTNGSDHLYQDPEFTRLVKEVQEKFSQLSIVNGSFEDYSRMAQEAAKKEELFTISGELRDFRYGPDPSAVTSTRVKIKQLLFETQNVLERYTEPIAVMATALCKDYKYPEEFLRKVWKKILISLGHDGISGCSSDEVMRDIESYLTHAGEISARLRELAFESLIEGESGQKEEEQYLVVFNPHLRNYSGITEQTIHIEGTPGEYRDFILTDSTGAEIPYEILEQWDDIVTREHLYNSKEKIKRRCSKILFRAEDVPALGMKFYKIQRRKYLDKRENELYIREYPSSPMIENEFYRIQVNGDATINVYDKKSKKWHSRLHELVVRGEAGDEYQHASPLLDCHIFPVLEGISMVANSELSQSLCIDSFVSVPKSRMVQELGQKTGKEKCQIRTTITLYRNTDRIDFCTVVDNKSCDFVLYAKFPTELKGGKDYSYISFDEVIRDDSKLSFNPSLKSTRSLEKPMQRYGGIVGDDGRMDIFAKGLYEYHTKKGEKGTDFYLTLLRSSSYVFHGLPISWLDGQESTTPIIETMGSRELGRNVLEYALCLNHPDTKMEVQDYIYPLYALETKKISSMVEKGIAFLKIADSRVQLSALKCARDGSIIVRLYYTGKDTVKTELQTQLPVDTVWICNLLEEQQEEIDCEKYRIPVTMMKNKILTLKIKWEKL